MIVSVPVKLITFPAAAQIAEVVAWEATVAYAPFIKLDAVSVVNARSQEQFHQLDQVILINLQWYFFDVGVPLHHRQFPIISSCRSC